MDEVIDESLLLVEARAKERKIGIERNCRESYVVAVDRRIVRQMLVSLLTNAIKYCPRGTRVAIDCATIPDGSELRVTIADDGPGMTPEELAMALSPFGRSPDARNRAIGGVGLGLPLVNAFMEAHRGRLELDAAPGEGTRATLVFPLAPEGSSQAEDVAVGE